MTTVKNYGISPKNVPDLGSGENLSRIRIQRVKKHRIPVPQHFN
jgi:hypothetical protein